MSFNVELAVRLLKDWQANYGFDDINSLLELLWSSYTEYNPIYNDSMKEKVRKIRTLTRDMPKKDEDALFDVILELYEENERESFLDGIRVGARLTLEQNGEI